MIAVGAMRRGEVGTVHAETITSSDGEQFVRIFLTCPKGHGLGSIPVDMALAHPFEIDMCRHYECKKVRL